MKNIIACILPLLFATESYTQDTIRTEIFIDSIENQIYLIRDD